MADAVPAEARTLHYVGIVHHVDKVYPLDLTPLCLIRGHPAVDSPGECRGYSDAVLL